MSEEETPTPAPEAPVDEASAAEAAETLENATSEPEPEAPAEEEPAAEVSEEAEPSQADKRKAAQRNMAVNYRNKEARKRSTGEEPESEEAPEEE